MDKIIKNPWYIKGLERHIIHLEGIEPPSQEPESYVISITLKVATDIIIPHFKQK